MNDGEKRGGRETVELARFAGQCVPNPISSAHVRSRESQHSTKEYRGKRKGSGPRVTFYLFFFAVQPGTVIVFIPSTPSPPSTNQLQ